MYNTLISASKPITSWSFTAVTVMTLCFVQETDSAEWQPLQIITWSVWPSLEIKHTLWLTKVSTPVISLYLYRLFCHAHNTWIHQRTGNNGYQHNDVLSCQWLIKYTSCTSCYWFGFLKSYENMVDIVISYILYDKLYLVIHRIQTEWQLLEFCAAPRMFAF